MAPKMTPGAVFTQIPRFVIDQAMGALRNTFGGSAPAAPQSNQVPVLPNPDAPVTAAQSAQNTAIGAVESKYRREPWFGPSRPMNAVAPRADVAGRAADYPVGYNLSITPRQYEPVSFNMIRGLFEGLDLAKICVNTRKNQMSKLSWEISPRMKPGQQVRTQDDPRCAQLEAFFRSPDRLNNWDSWMRMLLHDLLVFDAPAIYVRRTVAGDVYSLEVIDGTTITLRYDTLGRVPQPPDAAYTQVLHGIPAINYTTDELIYFPRNKRPGKLYGWSEVEQILMTIQIAIRRDINKLQFYTEGNIPDALIGVPPDWTPDQIRAMQNMFDGWTSDQANRRKAYFIPGGTSFNPTRPAQTLDPQQDEWLARVVTYAFNLPNLPLVQGQNRATSETANDAALREGLAPLIVWLKGLIDQILGKVFGFPDLEFIMDNYREENPDAVSARELQEVRSGALSIDEYRAKRGQSPLGMGAAIFGVGPAGVMFIDDIVRAHKQGALAPQLPAPPDAAMGAAGAYDDSDQNNGQTIEGTLAPSGQNTLPVQGQIHGKSASAIPIPANAPEAQASPQSTRTQSTPVRDITNHSIVSISPSLLAAVGLKPDYRAHARPTPQKNKQVPQMVLDALQHHESKFKQHSQ